jgi:hypothetical protein
MLILRSTFLVILVVFIANSSSGKVRNMDLEQVVSESDVILIGETVKIVETTNDKGFVARGVATIRVEKIIKGTVDSREVDIIYQPCVQAVSPKYSLCEKCVFFLDRAETSIISTVYFENVEGKYFTAGGI